MNDQAGDKYRKFGEPDHEAVCVRMYSEQEWIDWLLGTLSATKRSEMAQHLDHCALCLKRKSDWAAVLGIGGEDGALPVLPAMSAAGRSEQTPIVSAERMSGSGPKPDPEPGTHAATLSVQRSDPWADAVPSERIRRSLRRRVRGIGWRRRALRLLTVRWKWTVSLAAALMILAGMGHALVHLNQPEASWDRYVQTYEPEALPVLSKPDTISYPIAMGRLQPEKGMVWYNAATREMLMLVGGLVPDKGQTIRVWIVKEGARDSLGLLKYNANRAHLYVKDRTLNVDDSLELTIEPAYGAPEVNRGPNSISLDLLGR